MAENIDNKEKKVVIELDNVRRNFMVGDEVVHALKGVSFKIYEGEFVTIMGKSGSGKSTLLNQLGCLDTPSSGEYYLDGVSVRKMSRNDRAILRNRKIGFIFQNYNLLPKTTSVENVELPLMYNPSVTAEERKQRAIEALKAVGLGERLYHKSNQMSGGQMQRVAIARALVNDPAVILADEGSIIGKSCHETTAEHRCIDRILGTLQFLTGSRQDALVHHLRNLHTHDVGSALRSISLGDSLLVTADEICHVSSIYLITLLDEWNQATCGMNTSCITQRIALCGKNHRSYLLYILFLLCCPNSKQRSTRHEDECCH